MGAREYDPRTARWLQRDPIDASSGDPNPYRYCGNDPVSFTDMDGSDKEEKQPNKSAGKKAEEKTEEKVAFICVGDFSYGLLTPLVALGVSSTVYRVANDLRRAGYKVVVDRECTAEDAGKALADPSVAAFVFIGHSSSDPETGSYALLTANADEVGGLTLSSVQSALGGRRLERVELYSCGTDIPEWRNAFGNPEKWHAQTGLYNPVLGLDYGKLGAREKKERNEERKRDKKRVPWTRGGRGKVIRK